MDYVEGWYDGNAERMERALHPDLAKRVVITDMKSGRPQLVQMSAMGLVQATRNGGGKETPKEKRQKDMIILDVYENAASVKATMSDWIDYLHDERGYTYDTLDFPYKFKERNAKPSARPKKALAHFHSGGSRESLARLRCRGRQVVRDPIRGTLTSMDWAGNGRALRQSASLQVTRASASPHRS